MNKHTKVKIDISEYEDIQLPKIKEFFKLN